MADAAHKEWRGIEDEAAAKRIQLSQDALHELLGGDREDLPTVGVCLSGGGWRAMMSGCALFDALSVPVKAEETATGAGRVKLMDCVSHAFGLSGGSWLLFTTLAGGDFNAFHHGYLPGDAQLLLQRDSYRGKNPWLYGKDHSFNPQEHAYEGLLRMVGKSTVDEACHRGGIRKTLGFVTTTTNTDSTIGAALACKRLGDSLTERWSNFIANDILAWLDDGAPPKVQADLADEITDELSSSKLTESAKDKRAAELARILAADNTSRSRNLDLSAAGALIREGKLPFMVCSAIADRPGAPPPAADNEMQQPGKEASAKPGVFASSKRHYDWVEFTPFFSRNPATGVMIKDVQRLKCIFSKGSMQPASTKIHHMMGICGSAFACDMACALPPGVSRHVELPQNAVIGRGTTDVVGPAGGSDEAFIGTLRDAGIDFNVPLPPMLQEAGREFDILIVQDAGGGSIGPYELQRAVELGYLELMDNSHVTAKFYARQRVKVFRGKNGFPTIIYFLGLTQRGTHQIIQGRNSVLRDVASLRESVHRHLEPVILHELRNVCRMKKMMRETGEASVSATAGAALNLFSHMGDSAEATLGGDDVDTTQEASPDDDGGDEADLGPAQKRLDALVGSLPAATKQIMFNAAARGVVNSPFDAFVEVETVLLSAVVDPAKRPALLQALQQAAVSATTSGANVSPSAAFAGHAADVRETFVSLGAIDDAGALTPPFADYWTAAALVQINLNRASVAFFERRLPLDQNTIGALAGVPLTTNTRIWPLAAAGCVGFGADGALAPNSAHVVRQAINGIIGGCMTDKGADPNVLRKLPALKVFAFNFSVMQASGERADAKASVEQLVSDVSFAAGANAIRNEHMVNDLKQIVVASVAAGAASAGHLAVINACIAAFPPLFADNSDAAKCIVGMSYESPNAQVIQQWVFSALGVSITFADACRLGLAAAVFEMAHQRQNLDRKEETLAAIAAGHEECVTIIFTHAATPPFRQWIAGQCVSRGLYWEAITTQVESIEIPSDPREMEKAVTFAEKCKRLVNVSTEKAAPATSALGARFEAVRSRAHERAEKHNARARVDAAKEKAAAAATTAATTAKTTGLAAVAGAKKLFSGFGKKK